MKFSKIIIALLFFISCHDTVKPVDQCVDRINLTFVPCAGYVNVSANQCVIKEARVAFSTGYEHEKYVYFYDGTDYYKIDRYDRPYDADYPDSPNATIRFSYEQGRIKEVIYASNATPNSYLQTTYAFLDTEVRIQVFHIVDGVSTQQLDDSGQLYLSNPKDSIYHYVGPHVADIFQDQYLGEYKAGNRVRFGVPASDGNCQLYDIKWRFIVKSYFDNLANVLRDYAVRYPFQGGNGLPAYYDQFWLANNANNTIAIVNDNGAKLESSQDCWTFLVNSSQQLWLKKFVTSGGEITYIYDCE